MLTSLKAFIAALLAPLALPLFYLGLGTTSVVSMYRRAEWALYALIVVTPLPNVRYRFLEVPFGKDLIDILVASAIVGIFVNKGGFKRSPNGVLLWIFISLLWG